MQRLMRAAIGTNNIDNCSRVCHSPTSFALRKSLGLSGATGSFTDFDHADAAIIIGANPTEGHPVVGARIKQATLRGHEARHDRPAPDRARRLRRPAPLAAARHQRRRDARPRPRRRTATGSPTATSSTRAPRATSAARGCSRSTRRRPSRRSPASPPPTSSRPPTSTPRPTTPAILVGPRRDRAQVRLRGRAADLQPRADDRQDRPRPASALLPLRGQNNVQGSSDMGALPDTFTAYRSVGDEDGRALVRGGAGASPLSREKGLTIPRDVRRRGRRRPQGDVHLRRGRRPDRPEHRRT